MRKNIASVIDAFHAEETYQDKTCRTDGKFIYSYALAIAAWIGGRVVVLDRASAPSATTRSHIDAVRQAFPDAITMPIDGAPRGLRAVTRYAPLCLRFSPGALRFCGDLG